MSEIVTIYEIHCFTAPEPGQEGESCSLLPWRNQPGLRGSDDGGRDYVLPEPYRTGTMEDGKPVVITDGGEPCSLMFHNERPLLIDSRQRKAYLLEPVKKIASYRQMLGMTLSDLALRLHVEPKLLYEWENLEREPDEETLSRIASSLGCKPSDLR